jgi:hypothetical protein
MPYRDYYDKDLFLLEWGKYIPEDQRLKFSHCLRGVILDAIDGAFVEAGVDDTRKRLM